MTDDRSERIDLNRSKKEIDSGKSKFLHVGYVRGYDLTTIYSCTIQYFVIARIVRRATKNITSRSYAFSKVYGKTGILKLN